MTPCEEMGYKVGDKFEVINEEVGFQSGQVVTLFEDDGSAGPLFKGKNTRFNNADGDGGAYMHIGNVRPVNKSQLTKQLAEAVKKRDKHRAKADKWHGEVERLTGQLEREIEDATGLRCRTETVTDAEIEDLNGEVEDISIPDGVDPDDPATWKEGDVVECVATGDSRDERKLSIGGQYSIQNMDLDDPSKRGELFRIANWWPGIHTGTKFRFVRRPSEG